MVDAGGRWEKAVADLRRDWVAYLWGIAYLAHSILGTVMPRTDKATAMREVLRGWHYALGTVLGVLSIYLVVHWWKRRREPVNPAMPALANRWSFAQAFAVAFVLAISPLLGLLNAWGDGLPVHFGPLPPIPQLVEESRALWLFFGYFHSAFGFAVTVMKVVTLVSAAYFLLRYGQGLFAAFLPGYGLLILLGAITSVYAMATFGGPEPGLPAVAVFLAIFGVVWGLARLLRRQPYRGAPRFSGRAGLGAIVLVGVLVPIGLAMYAPYAMFRVKPIEMGEVKSAPAGVTSHPDPVVTVEVVPETALERGVRAENYKWCTFCHTMKKGERHLAGPNLYGIFGREIGTVPNFSYTSGMAVHGKRGEVWTDEAMDRLLADPDAFAPGTTMIVSSGNVTDPQRRAALINILKKETMGDAVRLVEPDDDGG